MKKQNFIIVWACLANIFTFSLAAEQFKPVPLAIGKQAPDFKLKGVDDKDYTLDSFADYDYVVMAFTSNHCPDAIGAWERLNDFAAEYKSKGVAVVAISSNDPLALRLEEYRYSIYGDSFEEMKMESDERQLVFPYLYDGDTQVAAKAYGAMATPHMFILNKERKLVYQGHFDSGRRNQTADLSEIEHNTVRDNINTLLAGGKLAEPTTRVHGCSTKWSYKRDTVAQKEAQWQALPVEVEMAELSTIKTLVANPTNKLRIINVWSIYCPPCVAEFPDLVDTYRRYDMRGVELITIALDEAQDAGEVKKFLTEQALPVSPYNKKSVVAEGRTTNNYQYAGDDLDEFCDIIDPKWLGPIPYTLVVAPGGEVIFRHQNEIDPIELRKVIIKYMDDNKVK